MNESEFQEIRVPFDVLDDSLIDIKVFYDCDINILWIEMYMFGKEQVYIIASDISEHYMSIINTLLHLAIKENSDD